MSFELEIMDKAGNKHTRSYEDEIVKIGREAKDVLLHLQDMNVSRWHARIEKAGAGYRVCDWKSNGHTYVEGDQIDQAGIELKDGDRIRIGDYQLVFRSRTLSNAGGTMFLPDPELAAENLARGLKVSFARALEVEPEARRATLRNDIEAGLAGARDENERLEILSHLGNCFQEAGERPRGAAQPDDALLVASQNGMQRLAQQLLSGKTLRTPAEVKELCTRLETILPVVATGLVEALKARAVVREEISADTTRVHAGERNPVKAVENPADLLKVLFDPAAAMDATSTASSLQSAFRDLIRHPMGLLHGAEYCVKQLLDVLSPEKIGKTAEGGVVSKLMPKLAKRAASWAKYCEVHESVRPDDFAHALREGYRQVVEGTDSAKAKKPGDQAAGKVIP